MRIFVDRFLSNDQIVLSRIFINGRYFCFGQESIDRIPAGTYRMGICPTGNCHDQYKKQFANIHKGMLDIQDVPGHEHAWIYHDVIGECHFGYLIIGDTAKTNPDNISVADCFKAYQHFYTKTVDSAIMGRLEITFQDHDPKLLK